MQTHALLRTLLILAVPVLAMLSGAKVRASCTSGDVDYSTSGSGSVTSFTCTETAPNSNTFNLVLIVASTGVYNVTIETFDDAIIN